MAGVSTATIVLFHQGSTELRRCENCVFFLPVNIPTGVARRLLGPHNTLPCVLIMTGDQFYDMVKEAHLNIHHLKPTEQRACAYDQKPITLDGQIDTKIAFGGKTIVSTVFVKLIAPDKLLPSENVCRMLDVVSYHPDVQPVDEPRSAIVL